MPHTSYALFKGIRSHQISSPTVEASARFGTPNACNLCHLDKTLAWTQEHLASWYKSSPGPLTSEQQTVSAALLWTLKGHAAQRAIAAWHLGWKPAQEASGATWLAPFAAQLLQDPYGVVRYVAARSLRTLPGFDQFQFDFLGSEAHLLERTEAALRQWKAGSRTPPKAAAPALFEADGSLMEGKVKELVRARDNRSVTVKE